jgi:hypothetical protein
MSTPNIAAAMSEKVFIFAPIYFAVMAGLVPAIHVSL